MKRLLKMLLIVMIVIFFVPQIAAVAEDGPIDDYQKIEIKKVKILTTDENKICFYLISDKATFRIANLTNEEAQAILKKLKEAKNILLVKTTPSQKGYQNIIAWR